jgi:RNA 2',3'-cyclic 3'-phosphodiesterase
MDNSEEIRTFFALPCGESLSRQLADLSGFLEDCPGIKRTPPHEYHITLKFLGKTPVELLSAVEEKLRRSIGQIPPFHLKLPVTGCFPKVSNPRILWIGNRHSSRPLRQIVLQLNLGFRDYGYPRDENRFKPHVTLGRVKRETKKECIEKFMNLQKPELILKAEHIIWYESKLSSAGPEYIERMRIPLKTEKGR